MKKNRIYLLVLLVSTGLITRAQDPAVIREYIDTYKDLAISEMQRTGVPASIKLAQGIHETMAGTSDLVKMSNNHFGIKCKTGWTGESVSHDDDARGECFRKYDQAADSYRDHSDFLRGSARYALLFKLDPLDYADWAYGLKKAGYATNPRYPQIIIHLIEEYHLQDYTLIAMGKVEPKDEGIARVSAPEEPVDAGAVAPADTENLASHYPSGEFKINETRVVFAAAATSLLSIAQQYNVPLARIYEFNEMEKIESLPKDRLVYLQRKRRTGNNEFHIVKSGETTRDIATEEAIRLETLLEYNHLRGNMQPAIGERLYLRTKAPGTPRLARGDLAATQ